MAKILISLLWILPNLCYSQFQTTIGNPYPLGEYCPGGVLTPSGDFVMFNNDFDSGTGTGRLFCSKINNFGTLINFPQKLIQPGPSGFENARWIEPTSCNGANDFIALADDGKYIILSLLDANCNPIWVRQIGDPNLIAEGACVKVDADGNFETRKTH